MKNSSYIAELVFKLNLMYVRLQNKTKEMFFEDLDNNADFNDFKTKIEELWYNIDHSYMEEELLKFEEYMHENNVGEKIVETKINYIPLLPLMYILLNNEKFVKVKEREYRNALNSYSYQVDKQEYLKLKVNRYNNQVVPYYSRQTGEIVRYVQPSTYNSMIFNTNLTRTGWNTTLNDANILGSRKFIIPYHSFSCPHCIDHQEKIMTISEVLNLIGFADEAEGNILHPNCKCVLTIYDEKIGYVKSTLNDYEKEEIYQTRQKVNTLTLRKEELLSDIKIQKKLGNQDEVDKLNQKRNKINSQIRDLKDTLPTNELKKQVVAINR